MKPSIFFLVASVAIAAVSGCATSNENGKLGTADERLAQPSGVDGVAQSSCPHFVDEDGDGVCDRRASGTCPGGCPNCTADRGDGSRARCAHFVDADGDGVCDRAGSGCGMMGGAGGGPEHGCGMGRGFVDADGDGVCDHAGRGRRLRDGAGAP